THLQTHLPPVVLTLGQRNLSTCFQCFLLLFSLLSLFVGAVCECATTAKRGVCRSLCEALVRYEPIPIQSESLNAEYQPIPIQSESLNAEYEPIPIQSESLNAEYEPIPI
uniref:Uncharacterized protein n=1 Tax=Astyanax mexicanus TaxID=7994 RepID=A0A8B9J4P6_ASTMX